MVCRIFRLVIKDIVVKAIVEPNAAGHCRPDHFSDDRLLFGNVYIRRPVALKGKFIICSAKGDSDAFLKVIFGDSIYHFMPLMLVIKLLHRQGTHPHSFGLVGLFYK
jgi:hypothetical protein